MVHNDRGWRRDHSVKLFCHICPKDKPDVRMSLTEFTFICSLYREISL